MNVNSAMSLNLNQGPPLPIPPAGPPRPGQLDRFLVWLLKPIDFPGKWPVIEPPSERYNRDVRSKSQRPHDE
jgi:hypothetical protein